MLRSSKFKEEGKLTPEEFVVAGEQLVHTCGTWSWCVRFSSVMVVGDGGRKEDGVCACVSGSVVYRWKGREGEGHLALLACD